MNLHAKYALVTGGGIRIGRDLSLALTAAGCNVVIHYNRSADAAEKTKKDVKSFGVKSFTIQADLSEAEPTDLLIPTILEKVPRLDILVNCAGVFPDDDSFRSINPKSWDSIFAINLRAPFFLSRAFEKQIPKTKFGKIINITDAGASHRQADHLAYGLSKQSLKDLTQILAKELAPRITVNGLALGAILPPPGKTDQYLEELAQSRIPLRMAGTPDIVSANMLHFLKQDFITGVTINIDGGEYL